MDDDDDDDDDEIFFLLIGSMNKMTKRGNLP